MSEQNPTNSTGQPAPSAALTAGYDEGHDPGPRGTRASASARACTSATPPRAGCTTWSTNRRQLDRRGDGRLLPSSILVKINADGSCTVVDDGRGIPVGIHPTEKIPTVEVVFAKLGAGGKFEHNATAPTRPPAACTASAHRSSTPSREWWKSKSAATGKVHHMEFERGKKVQRPEGHRQEQQDRHQGHLQARHADLPRHRVQVRSRCRSACASWRFSTKACRSSSRTSAAGKRDEFKYEQGLIEYVKYLNDGKNVAAPDHLLQEGRPGARGSIVEVALQYNDGYNETIETSPTTSTRTKAART